MALIGRARDAGPQQGARAHGLQTAPHPRNSTAARRYSYTNTSLLLLMLGPVHQRFCVYAGLCNSFQKHTPAPNELELAPDGLKLPLMAQEPSNPACLRELQPPSQVRALKRLRDKVAGLGAQMPKANLVLVAKSPNSCQWWNVVTGPMFRGPAGGQVAERLLNYVY